MKLVFPFDKQSSERVERALYVVAHAYWQHSRKRNPSEPFDGNHNPKAALSDAGRVLVRDRWEFKAKNSNDFFSLAPRAQAIALILSETVLIRIARTNHVIKVTPLTDVLQLHVMYDRLFRQ